MQPSDEKSPHLSEDNLRQMAAARANLRTIRRAVSVARFDGWTLAVFAGLTMLCGLSSVSALILGAGMGTIAFIEISGATKLMRLDRSCVRTLALNQLALAGLLSLYLLWSMRGEMHGQGFLAEVKSVDPELASQIQPLAAQAGQMVVIAYGAMIAVVVLYSGGMAMYYFSLKRRLQDYLDETPAWIIEMQKSGVSI